MGVSWYTYAKDPHHTNDYKMTIMMGVITDAIEEMADDINAIMRKIVYNELPDKEDDDIRDA